jgi:electron transport complex protein RnfG
MREIIKMIVVLSLIAATTGAALSYINQVTEKPIAAAEFQYLKEPALKSILPAYNNNLVEDQRIVQIGEGETAREITVYPAKKDGKLLAIALETFASSYGGDLGAMVGYDLETKRLSGVSITTMSDTPGLGTRTKEPKFIDQFKNVPLEVTSALKADGGGIDAVTGASISSRAVCKAVNDALGIIRDNGDKIISEVQ